MGKCSTRNLSKETQICGISMRRTAAKECIADLRRVFKVIIICDVGEGEEEKTTYTGIK